MISRVLSVNHSHSHSQGRFHRWRIEGQVPMRAALVWLFAAIFNESLGHSSLVINKGEC